MKLKTFIIAYNQIIIVSHTKRIGTFSDTDRGRKRERERERE